MKCSIKMPGNITVLNSTRGLSQQEVSLLQSQYGKNVFDAGTRRSFLHIVWDIAKEPMFILLFIACALYFILGEVNEGLMMLAAMSIVAAISIYQEVRSSHALHALKQLAEPKVAVIRGGIETIILSEELVPGDIMLLSEGMKIPADAVMLQGNDLTVNEAIITGESLPVDKLASADQDILFQGTIINSGKCMARVTATGNNTVLGKIGKAVGSSDTSRTLLQKQLGVFVRRLAVFGLIAFTIIFLVNYTHHHAWAASLLFALTLAMSAIPEEIPVAFSSFMALGAYKMSKLGVISRQPQVVENLGAVSVICLDKTGTITENKMQVKIIYDYVNDSLIELNKDSKLLNENVLLYGMLASEEDPFDPMEIAIWEAYKSYGLSKTERPGMIYEYPLLGRPPMMTHVFDMDGVKIVAGKGGAERILQVCGLSESTRVEIEKHIQSLASKGYRVLGVSSAIQVTPDYPKLQDDFNWKFEGLLALYDPPKQNIQQVLKAFYDARIDVKLVTGDYMETAVNIAGQSGIINYTKGVNGIQVMNMNEEELKIAVRNTNVFARMFPEAKVKVIEALQHNNRIVAMTGDGVNDGPALKAANIGIAMGHRGTEIAREAADIIITDDNLERLVSAISEGRKIFSNLKKAVRYIISIHIPIILLASLPLIFGWIYPNIFTPIHVIFMELIMGPTCSIFFEREPVENYVMQQKPRESRGKLFTGKEISISILQGLVIAAGTLSLYYYFMNNGASIQLTRTIVFTTLILSNVFLTFTNRSFTQTIYYTSRYKNNLALLIIFVSAIFLATLLLIPGVRGLFQLTTITLRQFWLCTAVAFVCVMWFEFYKAIFISSVNKDKKPRHPV